MTVRNLVKVTDFTREEVEQLFEWAGAMRKDRSVDQGLLQGKVMALFFEKSSLRTRVTFEVGMSHLGGTSLFLTNQEINIGERETVEDVARNIERWVDILVARTMSHDTIVQLAKHTRIPVINALSDLYHPCQAITDLFTLWFMGVKMEECRMVFVGDGNNVCGSLLLLAGMMGCSMTVACPEGYEPTAEVMEETAKQAKASGAEITVTHDPHEAVKDATAIYTDVWASMGQEAEAEVRKERFAAFQVNSRLVESAGSNPYIMHCLPARRDEEITHAVLESDRSIVFEQAENRLHAQKAIVKLLMA